MKQLSPAALRERVAPYEFPVLCKCGHQNHTPVLKQCENHIGAYCQQCNSYIKWLRLKSAYSSGGFTKTILAWLPRLTDRDLGRIRKAIGNIREGEKRGIR